MRDDTRLSRCITPDGKSVDRCPLTGFAFLVYSYLVNLFTKSMVAYTLKLSAS